MKEFLFKYSFRKALKKKSEIKNLIIEYLHKKKLQFPTNSIINKNC